MYRKWLRSMKFFHFFAQKGFTNCNSRGSRRGFNRKSFKDGVVDEVETGVLGFVFRSRVECFDPWSASRKRLGVARR